MLSNPKLTFFWASHHTYIHLTRPSLFLNLTSALTQSTNPLFLQGLKFGGGFPESPLGLHLFLWSQVGRDGHQSVHTLSTRGLLWAHPSSSSRKWLQMMARSDEEKPCTAEETARNTLHGNGPVHNSLKHWDRPGLRGDFSILDFGPP